MIKVRGPLHKKLSADMICNLCIAFTAVGITPPAFCLCARHGRFTAPMLNGIIYSIVAVDNIGVVKLKGCGNNEAYIYIY